MCNNTEEITRLREILRAVRTDIWTAQIHSSHHEAYKCQIKALDRIDAELGEVSPEERLETLFPNLRR